MPILYAELQVLGRQVPCARVSFAFHQAIDEQGRPSSDVRVERLKVVLTGEPAGWGVWEELKFDEFRRVSGWVLFFEGEGQTAKRYAFYDAALVWLEFGYDGQGTAGRQAATQVELHFAPAAVEVDGQRIEAYSVIPWQTDPQTSFRALTQPADPQPSAHLAALLTAARLQAEELGTGLLKKVITPAGEVATEILGVSAAALARAASLTAGLLLAPANDPDAPGYDSEKHFARNHPVRPPDPEKARLAVLEAQHGQGTLTAEEEAELISLLAKVKGIHDTKTQLAGSGPQNGVIEVSDRVKSVKAFQHFNPKAPVDFVYDPTTNRLVVATSRTARNGHPGLVKSLGATERSIVGGRLRRGANGELETSEWSGHYGDQWTPTIRHQFSAFMLQQTGKPVQHSGNMHFSDGTN